MAGPLPAGLKAAGLQPFATRAAQLEKYRPIVWYWCEYYILQQILAKQLHLGDAECQEHAVQLMDKLEAYKSANASNDAIVDDVAAKAYIENFALETFNRADEAQRTNKVTRQTADTFQASGTFIELLTIWGALEPDLAAKAKFAKYHALRIAKAIKAGQDPNETNPKVEESPAGDGLDAELQALEQQNGGGRAYQPPSVEDAPVSGQPSRPESVKSGTEGAGEPSRSHPVRQWSEASQMMPTIDTAASPAPQRQPPPDVSPIDPAESHNERQGSVGGGYFPSVPDTPADHAPEPDSARPEDPPITGSQPTKQQQHFSPGDFYTSSPHPNTLMNSNPTVPGVTSSNKFNTGHTTPAPPPSTFQQHQPRYTPSAPAPVAHVPPAQHFSNSSAPPAGGYRTDDESVLAAQKHAKWAISALNFEDVNTAVKELRIALQSLGAS